MDAKETIIRQILAEFVMFSALGDAEKNALAPLFEVKDYSDSDVIAQQNTPMDFWEIIHHGKVRLKKDESGKRVSVGELGKDASYGERCLIDADSWPHTIIASEDTTTVSLPAEKVRTIIQQHPKIKKMFQSRLGVVELSHRLRGMLGDASYSRDDFESILTSIGVKNIPRGGTVFKQGQSDPRLYCVEKGVIDLVRHPISGEKVILDRLYRGDLLGETNVLPPPDGMDSHHHSAVAISEDVSVLVIKQEAANKLLEINPDLLENLRVRVKQLLQNEDNEIAVRKRAEGVDQRIRLADAVTEEEYRAMDVKKEVKRFNVVKQSTEADCAAACITMVCQHYGKEFTMGQIRELANLSTAHITPNQIISGAERMGFSARPYALHFDDLKTIKLPCVIGWENYHYVVIYRVTKKEVFIADPAEGLKKLKKDEFMRSWSAADVKGTDAGEDKGVLIALDPTQRFELREVPKKPIYHFLNFILPYKRFFLEAMVAALTINILGLASPLFIQTIVDTVVVHQDVSLLNMMLAGMVLVSIFSTLAGMAQNLLLAHTTARIDMRMMSEFYRHILSLPMNFFLTRNKGEILARFGENQKIRAIISGSTVTVLLNTLMIFIYFLMMFGYSVPLTFAFMIFIPMYLGIILYFTPRIKKISMEMFETSTQSQSRLIESLNGIETLKATATEYMARANWENSFVENVNRSFRSTKLNMMSGSLNKLVSLSSQVVILWLGANQVMDGTLSIGELMGFNMLSGMIIGPILQMVGLWNALLEVRISVDRVGEFLSVEPEQQPISEIDRIPASLQDFTGRIDFRGVNFSYVINDQENFVMRDFDLSIEPGQRLAFVGASGCGKSTIAKMILGFNMPSSGECLVDGKEIRDIDLTTLRRNIGVVLQDSFIMAGTVAENIALGDPEPDMSSVAEAARLAGAHEFIINYPVAYQTLIGEKGMGISGGQRQRICIARALYRKPKVLIFDEATSALDNESEKRIQENMQTILRGRTSITIAHRLSTIIDSDIICFIADGKVAEKGSHDQLINIEYLKSNGYKGLYYNLAKSQFNLPDLDLEDDDV